MNTRNELKAKAMEYITNKYSSLINNIETAMLKAAENGHLCLYRYSVENEDQARSMERYFKARDFSAESSWSNFNEKTKEYTGWYVSIFWW